MRIQDADLNKFYLAVHEGRPAKFTFNESFVVKETQTPKNENSIIWLGFPIWIRIAEVHLHTGWNSKEIHCTISTLRLFKGKLNNLLKGQLVKGEVHSNVYINLAGWGCFTRTNKLPRNKFVFENLVLDSSVLHKVLGLFYEFFIGTRTKAGLILYGPPGNGKTSLIRTLACEFNYDIYCPVFRPDMTNPNIIEMFSNIPNEQKSIVVLEDFDSMFDGREAMLNNCAFSFDVFLNIIDGVYLNVDNFIFILTANDISKIDVALKNRPSRFDMVVNVDNPNYENRITLLKKMGLNENLEKIAKSTEGISCAILCELSRRKPTSYIEAECIVQEFSTSESQSVNIYHSVTKQTDGPYISRRIK